MDKKIKEQKLRDFANSVFDYLQYKEEFQFLLTKLNLTKEEVIQSYVNYDLDIFEYENKIYESLPMRFVLHLHNILKGSWHQDRQNTVLEMVRSTKPKSIVDMGFGVPTKYLREHVLKQKIKTVLVDLYESAFRFSEALLDYLEPKWRSFILFKKLDMNTQKFIGDFDCYIFQDSIEHVKSATKYLTKTVKLSPTNAKFILSLPVGPWVPVHTISWDAPEDVKKWLDGCGLKIDKMSEVHVNKKVDLFAEQFEKEFYNLIVLCSKK